MNDALAKGREELLAATCIFVTLGTAWVFRHREVRELVERRVAKSAVCRNTRNASAAVAALFQR